MAEIRITRTDLDWWLEFAAALQWTFAKTYAGTAPHHYIVEGRTPDITHEDMVRAARVIHTFGTPGKYYSLTKLYLVSPDGNYRWWTEDDNLGETNLVNRAPTDRHYGIQNAPSTVSGIESPYDEVATVWDGEHPIRLGEPEHVKQLLADVRGKYPPHALDIGCGTGRVLDLGLIAPQRYAALDSSQAMLNMLIRKHPNATAVYPLDVSDLLAEGTFTPGQFDWVFLDSAVQLTPDERGQIEQIARLAVIDVDENDWTVSDVAATSEERILAEAEALASSHVAEVRFSQ